jgi:hypothetical protein
VHNSQVDAILENQFIINSIDVDKVTKVENSDHATMRRYVLPLDVPKVSS